MIVVKFVRDKQKYQEWDLIPRVTIVIENKSFLGIAFGWLIFGIAIAIKKSAFNKKLNNL